MMWTSHNAFILIKIRSNESDTLFQHKERLIGVGFGLSSAEPPQVDRLQGELSMPLSAELEWNDTSFVLTRIEN